MRFTNGPLNAIYAQVWDEDLGEVSRWVTLRTLSRPAAALPAASLPSWIWELYLMAVRAQVELRASNVGVYVPAHSTDAEDRLAYHVSEMVLANSRMCKGSS